MAIAVILSAQCTDERVNKVTPTLFAAFPTLDSFSQAKLEDIETIIFPTGFYRNKAKSIKGFATKLIIEYNGILPKTIGELTSLPGIGRKTANVILNELYDISEGFVVDTHVKRIAGRLGLTKNSNPVKIEQDLMKNIKPEFWSTCSLYFIFLGRSVCTAYKTECSKCILGDICISSKLMNDK